MSNARDKANIPALNFSSTGIDDNATSTAITIDPNQDVGIGTGSATYKLDVAGEIRMTDGIPIFHMKDSTNSNSRIYFENSSDVVKGQIFYSYTDNFLRLDTDSSERMRIDSSGNVLVGKTSSSAFTDGVTLNSSGGYFSHTNDRPVIINRNGSDGGLIEFYKDGSSSLNLRTISGGLEFSSGSTGYLNILSNGNIGINKTDPANKLHVKGTATISAVTNRTTLASINPTPSDENSYELGPGYLNLFRDDTATVKQIVFGKNGSEVGSISTTGSATAYNTSSDYRLKENVVDLTNATERLKQLQPKRFNFISDTDTTVDGFIAHEVSSVVPEAVTGTHNEVKTWKEYDELPEGVSVGDNKLDENGNTIPEYQGIDQAKLVPLLVKTIQELEARITTLENA